MASFLRKVASAFVVTEEEPTRPSEQSGDASALASITSDASSLLSQLGAPSSPMPPGTPGPGYRAGGKGLPADAAQPRADVLAMSVDDVFRSAQLDDGPNSSPRLLKIIAGLAMFPREQQTAMVRAMDAADDSWSEADVVSDAHRRLEALRAHLRSMAAAQTSRVQALAQEIESTRKGGDAVLAELDKQLAALKARRDQESQATATAVAKLEGEQQRVAEREAQARQGVSQVVQALVSLLGFLGAPLESPPARK